MRRCLHRGVLVAALLMSGCASDGAAPAGTSNQPTGASAAPSSTATGTTPPDLFTGDVRLVELARLDRPTAMAVRRGDPAMYVLEQGGTVRAIRDGRLEPEPVLDITGDVRAGGEQGLLGIAFSPDGGHMYLDYTDTGGDTHLTEWAIGSGGQVDRSSRRDVLTQDQPYTNHNGGQLAFGPDGYLYIALGDGGSGGDPHGNAQSLDTWLGKILRIDPRPAAGRPYRVPPDNPFAGRGSVKPEIWAYGLRNPWRFSFDPATGDLWIGDVGQNAWEEVNRQPAGSGGGEDYGWNLREGRHEFRGDRPDDAVDPVLEYPLNEGGTCSVIGGAVYRGDRIPGLAGHYLYGDFCAGWVRAAVVTEDGVGESRELADGVDQLSSFGTGRDGELYLLSLAGPVYRIAAG